MLTINYTYYNNPELLDQVVKHYEPFYDDEWFNFTIIDDGSQDHPLTAGSLPDAWRILRIPEDHGWGNEICKNLLIRNSETTWNALIDLDYVIDLKDEGCYKALTTEFKRYYSKLYHAPICFQFEKGRRHAYNDIRKEDTLVQNSKGFLSINS